MMSDNPFKSTNNKPNPFMNNTQEKNENTMTLEDVNTPKIKPKFINEINGAHTATVNIVRFSPNGMYLATGGDDSAIVIWIQKSRPIEFGSTIEKVTWCNYKILRGHLSDIYDISWSQDSKYLVSGSVDNSAIVWSLEKGKTIQKFNDHSHFVQGVSWDPRNKYVITQSSDKSAKIYKNAKVKQDVKFFFAHGIKRYDKNQINQNGIQNNNIPTEKHYEEDNYKMDVDTPEINILTEKSNSNLGGKKDKSNYQYYFADENQCNSYL